jgi:hypothetical protein
VSHTPCLLVFCSLLCPLRTVVAVYRFGTGPHTLCSPARLLALLAPCKVVCPSSPRRSLVSHSRPLQRDSIVFIHLVFHLCTHYRWVSCPWLLFPWNGSWLQAQVFGLWCAWRRREVLWNLSPLGLPACLSLPHAPHYLQLVFGSGCSFLAELLG